MRLRPATGQPIAIHLDGAPLDAVPGETVAAALFAHGIAAHTTGADGAPRGAFCGMGVCHDCLVTIDNRAGRRACLSLVADGMRIGRGAAFRPNVETLADLAPCPPGELAHRATEVAVVGAGPGGLAAAIAAARAGLRVLLLDERPKPGGQYFKQPAGKPPFAPDRQFRDGAALIARALAAGVAMEPETLVWGAFRDADGAGELGLLRAGVASRLAFRWLVIATGAFEQPQMVPGWTLPGVMTTGACQTLLRSYAVAPGRKVLFAGNGPLHVQVAAELLRAGGGIAAVADSAAPLGSLRDGLVMAATSPFLTARGVAALARLRLARVPLLWRHALKRIEGRERAEHAILAPLGPDGGFLAGREIAIAADAICLGTGFFPAAELPRLLGCAHEVSPGGTAQARRGDDGATSLPDVFVVGEAGGFGGAQIALAHGTLAGTEIARRAGRAVPAARATLRALRRAKRFQAALWSAFAPTGPPPALADETIVCRCEGLSSARLHAVAQAESVQDVATLKRLTRAGMGRCQGRYCAAQLGRIVGAAPARESDLIAPQVPLRPIPLAALAVEKAEWAGHRRSLLPPDRAAETVSPLPVREAATVVVGAGVVGLATAYFLARAGHAVAVIEAGRPNAMASGGNAGSLHVQLLSFDYGAKAEAGGSPAARTLPLQRDSVALWQALERDIGPDFEIKITGGVMVAESERDLRFLAAKTALERANGIACDIIGPRDLERMEPHLAPGLLGAAYCPDEGKINPLVATQGLLDAARSAGARVFDLTRVLAIAPDRGRFVLHTDRGKIVAGRIVNAAGAFASRVGEMVGQEIPVFGAPLQMIVTEAVAPMVSGLVAHADRHLTLKQAANGNIIIGGGWTAALDPVHRRPRPLRESLEGNIWVAQRVVPALRKLHMLRSWAAMNINIDGAPIIGEHPALRGFFNAVSSNGYTLGPIIGRITADLILSGGTDRDILPFGIERFGATAR